MKTKNNVMNVFLIVLLCFCLLITSSFAWFMSNRKTDSDDLGLGLEKDDTTATYHAYMYDLSTEKGTDKTPAGEDLSISNLILNQYDTIFVTKNKFTPAFAQISIIRNQSMPTDGTVHITIERKTKGVPTDADALTSNIVRFTTFRADSALTNPELADPDKLYTYINSKERFEALENYTENSKESKTFVTIVEENDGHKHEIADSITISVDYSENDWNSTSDGETLVVYLYISYDAELIKCYKNNHTENDLTLNDPGVIFENDFEKIRVSYTSSQDN